MEEEEEEEEEEIDDDNYDYDARQARLQPDKPRALKLCGLFEV